MSLSTDVNVDLLNECFELGPFHGLRKPHPDDEIEPQKTPTPTPPPELGRTSIIPSPSLCCIVKAIEYDIKSHGCINFHISFNVVERECILFKKLNVQLLADQMRQELLWLPQSQALGLRLVEAKRSFSHKKHLQEVMGVRVVPQELLEKGQDQVLKVNNV